MNAVRAQAERGGLVLGIGNGVQILCEAQLLPGVLQRNAQLRFMCKEVYLRVERSDTPYSRRYNAGDGCNRTDCHAGNISHRDGARGGRRDVKRDCQTSGR